MSNVIDIRKFVDVNIVHHVSAKLNTTRDTTVLFIDVATYGALDIVVSSWSEYLTAVSTYDPEDILPEDIYAKAYFDNGGQRLYLKSVDSSVAEYSLADDIKLLADEHIVVAAPSLDVVGAIQTLNTDAKFYGIKLKLGVALGTAASDRIPHLMYAYTVNECAAIAAYLSKIDVSRANSIKDYDFTPIVAEADSLTDAEVDTLMSVNVNISLKLAGQVRVVGGNTADGQDLVNEFTLIVLQQTVTEKVLTVLVEKLKGEIGVAAIHTAIAQELSRYVANGYLATDKIWKDETLTVTYGTPSETYVVIEKNTPLLLGYQIKILPYAALTDADKAEHKAPPIYIVLADSYGIRKVTINGEVF